ncbi:MAG: hypothetical protein KatS3mg031_0333 [Chitinophagales bacterium]|nr:MAG: hypothetical protein KatS3mg031_0333 [Chitinophagales bacterium]
MQKVIAQFNVPGMTARQYDQVMKDLEAAGFKAPKGRISHVASEQPNGWLVIDIWDSAETLNEFAKTLIPILIKNGVTPPQPTVLPVYNNMVISILQ